MWLIFALASSGLYAIAETFDNFFSNKEFKHPFTLVFYSSLFNLIYVPALFVFSNPGIPPLKTFPIFILLGIVNIGYLYPYYRGLKEDDTSVAISFLAIERVMVPILAFFIVGEILSPYQYLGILIIIISVVILGFHHIRKRFRFSKGVWYISCAAIFLAFEGVLIKLLFGQGVSVSTVVGGEAFMSLIFGTSVILIPSIRKDIIKSFSLFIKISPFFLIEELFTFLGLCTESKAISEAPVSIVKGVTMASPFFLVLYAWIGSIFIPRMFRENLHRKQLIKKMVLFAMLIIGVMLVKN